MNTPSLVCPSCQSIVSNGVSCPSCAAKYGAQPAIHAPVVAPMPANNIEQQTLVLPEYWASYLINGDHSGLSDDEKQAVDNFLGREDMRDWRCSTCSDESYFTRSNDAGTLAGSVLDYTFLKVSA